MPIEFPRISQQKEDLNSVASWLFGFFFLGLLFTGIFENTVSSIMWAVACWIAGGMVGFLFGVPKVDPTSIPAL
jgi:hypothetical protein